jgi:hypothetical protein
MGVAGGLMAAANAQIAQARGEAQSIVLKAQAQADANAQIAKSLGPDILRWRAVTTWDGRLPNFLGASTPVPFNLETGATRSTHGHAPRSEHPGGSVMIARLTTAKQRCAKCGGTYDRDIAFRKNRDARSCAHDRGWRVICIGCEQTERDKHKSVDAFIAKARGTIQRHAQRYHMTAPEFVRSYGWDVPRVAQP